MLLGFLIVGNATDTLPDRGFPLLSYYGEPGKSPVFILDPLIFFFQILLCELSLLNDCNLCCYLGTDFLTGEALSTFLVWLVALLRRFELYCL